eukprot:scaffold37736_cov155-Skeletonema_marinoi.AAC.6
MCSFGTELRAASRDRSLSITRSKVGARRSLTSCPTGSCSTWLRHGHGGKRGVKKILLIARLHNACKSFLSAR